MAAPRPLNSALSSERGLILPSFADALGRYLGEREVGDKRGGQEDTAHYAS
jgi:dTDP-4-dehydrorhamnose reductase